MAKVWMLWHGGASYSAPDTFNRRDCEAFASLRGAREDFARRPGDSYYPGCEAVPVEAGGPSAWIFFSDPFNSGDAYPDRVLSFGPRGGVRMENG
jgi:hypothetical protein